MIDFLSLLSQSETPTASCKILKKIKALKELILRDIIEDTNVLIPPSASFTMTPQTLEKRVIALEEIPSILHEAWEIAHTFGNRGAGNESVPTYQQYNRRGLAIEVLHCTDFCGVTNGYLKIKRNSTTIFYFDYGGASLANQRSARKDEIYAVATKVNKLNKPTRKEISFLYDLSCAAAATYEQRALEKAERDATVKQLLGNDEYDRIKGIVREVCSSS